MNDHHDAMARQTRYQGGYLDPTGYDEDTWEDILCLERDGEIHNLERVGDLAGWGYAELWTAVDHFGDRLYWMKEV